MVFNNKKQTNMTSFTKPTATMDLKAWKVQKLEAIRSFHMPLIKDLGVSPLDFNMKKAFYDSYGREVVGIFGSEFRKDKGFFFELITSDLDPIDPNRKVYRVPPNPNFEDEYEINQKNSYSVPLEELRVVNETSVAISKSSAVTSGDRFLRDELSATKVSNPPMSIDDAPYSDMTIRDYITIHSGKPVSNKKWLNDLITNKK